MEVKRKKEIYHIATRQQAVKLEKLSDDLLHTFYANTKCIPTEMQSKKNIWKNKKCDRMGKYTI